MNPGRGWREKWDPLQPNQKGSKSEEKQEQNPVQRNGAEYFLLCCA